MNLIDTLKRNDINVTDAVARLGQDELLYITICQKFLQDTNFNLFMKGIQKGDYQSARLHIHTLRGVAANMGFHNLEQRCKVIMDQLSSETMDDLSDQSVELSFEYNRIIHILETSL